MLGATVDGFSLSFAAVYSWYLDLASLVSQRERTWIVSYSQQHMLGTPIVHDYSSPDVYKENCFQVTLLFSIHTRNVS